MKKCLHLKKTKPHWRRKPPKVVTWKERREAERQRERERWHRRRSSESAIALMAAMVAQPTRLGTAPLLTIADVLTGKVSRP